MSSQIAEYKDRHVYLQNMTKSDQTKIKHNQAMCMLYGIHCGSRIRY